MAKTLIRRLSLKHLLKGMSMSVTGPQVTSFYSGDGLTAWQRSSWRQSKPRVIRLPYSFRRDTVTDVYPGVLGDWGLNPVSYLGPFPNSAGARAYSAALKAFSKGIGDTAELGVALAEKSKSVQMIVSRTLQLIDFTAAIKKGRFGDAAGILGISLTPTFSKAQEKQWSARQDKMFRWRKTPLKYPPKGQRPEPSKAKGAASNWLEYAFGWQPLVKDIHQACVNLQDGIPPITVRGTGSGSDSKVVQYPDLIYGRSDASVVVKCQIIADVTVYNPQAHLLAQMGLTNPLTIVLEVTKFSFVADWFSNLSQFLTAWAGYPGVSVGNAAVTYTSLFKIQYTDLPPFIPPRIHKGNIFLMTREPFVGTPPHPKFVLNNFERNHRFDDETGGKGTDFKGFSVPRGASAVALLVQRMRSL